MTLQEIADYSMDYLDSKGIAAEYEIFDDYVIVYLEDLSCSFVCNAAKASIENWLDVFI